ncbi:MAG: site-specific integrase [Tetragenococcus koreensis]|nr:site-specific integrase [Tetragenococcus koreensis]
MNGSVRKRGSKWYYSFEGAKINGKRTRYERVGGDTKAEAEKALRKALNEYEEAGAIEVDSDLSVQDYFYYWYDDYVLRNLKYNTQQNYKSVIDHHILPYIGRYKLKAIQPSVIQKVIDKNHEKGLAKQTLSIIQTVMTGAFKRAVYPYQFMKNDPTRYIQMPKYDQRKKKTKEDMRIITLEQFDTLLQHVPPASPFYIPMMIAFHTGLRRGEVLGLTWDNIDFDNQTLTVEKIIIMKGKEWEIGTPKTQSSYRTIGIGGQLIDILRKHKKKQMENRLFYGKYYTDNNFVCTKENGKLTTPHSLKHYSDKAKKESGVSFSFHSFRHTHATLLLENGAIDKAIQERLGHARIGTTMDTYSHLTKKTKKETVDIFERIVKK